MVGSTGGRNGRPGRGLGWSLRTRVFAVVALGAVPALTGAAIGTVALSSVNDKVAQINQQSVRTMIQLADLRDMEGDMRVNLRDLFTASDVVTATTALRETDDQMDADLAAYLREHGSRSDAEGRLALEFAAKLEDWRNARNTDVVAPLLAGDSAKAKVGLIGTTSSADGAMAGPLDRLFDLESAGAQERQKAAQQAYTTGRALILTVVLVGLVLSALAALLLIRRPVLLLRRITDVVASGDVVARVGTTDSSDLGRLGAALDRTLATISRQQDDLAAQQADRERQTALNFQRQESAEREVRERAQVIINETSTAVIAELKDVLEQAEAVRSASAEIDKRVGDADAMTRAVVDRAGSADTVVEAVTGSLRRVAGIAQLIAGVAEQTNLLALNATIEAARAGDAGRGFSVVANEVKELAAETGRSTGEISATVSALETDASAMAATIQEMSQGVGTMSDATGRVSEVAARQRESVERLDQCVQEAITRIGAMSQLTERLERRQARRVAVGVTAVASWAGRREDCEIVDLSETGARLHLDGPLPDTGDELVLEVTSPSYTATLRGTVVRQVGTPAQEVGATFLTLSSTEMAQLRDYLASLTGTLSV